LKVDEEEKEGENSVLKEDGGRTDVSLARLRGRVVGTRLSIVSYKDHKGHPISLPSGRRRGDAGR
jgi:hypothetical protein